MGNFNPNEQLIVAVFNQNLAHAEKSLREGAKINAKNFAGKTPLHYAMYFEDIDMVLLLLEYGADMSAKDNNNESPVEYMFDEWNYSQNKNHVMGYVACHINKKCMAQEPELILAGVAEEQAFEDIN